MVMHERPETSSATRSEPPIRQPGGLASLLKQHLIPAMLLMLAILILIAFPQRADAQSGGGAILIWPVGPMIEADERAAALWLENPGKTPVTLQVRIYAWAQEDGKNGYAAQDAILGTPPIVTIASGEKQLIRLTRTLPTIAATEAAYRVVIDEVPAEKAAGDGGAAVSFRMRYSIPLFAYGDGLASPDALAKAKPVRKAPRPTSSAIDAAPRLDWRVVETSTGTYLEIRNRSKLHARLTDVAFGPETGNAQFPDAQSADVQPAKAQPGGESPAKGLFGYVLAGATMRWPLERGLSAPTRLAASINGAPPAFVERRID